MQIRGRFAKRFLL